MAIAMPPESRIYVERKIAEAEGAVRRSELSAGRTDPFRIGGGGGPKLRFHGSIREVKVFKRALSGGGSRRSLPLNRNRSADWPRSRPISAPKRNPTSWSCVSWIASPRPRSARPANRCSTPARSARRYYDAIPTVMVMQERPRRATPSCLKRGAYDNPATRSTAVFPAVLPPLPAERPNNRLGLARWLVDPSNPLTARVA